MFVGVYCIIWNNVYFSLEIARLLWIRQTEYNLEHRPRQLFRKSANNLSHKLLTHTQTFAAQITHRHTHTIVFTPRVK